MKKITITVAAGLLALIGFIYFLYQDRSGRGVDIEFSAPEEIILGIPFDLDVNLINSSGSALKEARLFLTLPDGLAFVGSPASKNADFKELKNLADGSLNQQTFRLIATKDENSSKSIGVQLTYLSEALSSRFEKIENFEIQIGDPGLDLKIAVPEKINSSEEFPIEIFYKNISEIDFADLKLKLDYPLTFNFIKSSLKPDIGNNVWILGGLRKGSEMKFTINGSLIGPTDAVFDLKAVIESNLLGQNYPIVAETAALTLTSSPLSLSISLNGDPDYSAKSGEDLNYSINYSNNTDKTFNNVVIKAQLIGAMYDLNSLSAQGSFRSSDNTIIWDASNRPDLSSFEAGASGSVNFKLKVKNDYPIKRLSDKNFILKLAGRIESGKSVGLSSLETKVSGKVEIDVKGYFRDAASGILNDGPLPPKVGQATNFTIHLVLKNFGSDIKNLEVRTRLADNVKFVSLAKNNSDSSPIYDESRNEIVWNIAKMPANLGVLSGPLEAIAQVEAKPVVDDVGKYM